MKPLAKKLYCKETESFKVLSKEETSQYYSKRGQMKHGKISCVVFKKKGDPNTYLQPLAWHAFFRKKGIDNINARLNNEKVIEIYQKGMIEKSKTVKELANQFGVSRQCIQSVLKHRNWREVIFPHFYPKQNIPKVIQATNSSRGTKISAGIARFIARDNILHKIPIKSLAKKYFLSECSIRRIVTGKAWKEATKDLLPEVQVWT
jgi:Mor family transcriptional regulator